MEQAGELAGQFDAATLTALARMAAGREDLSIEGWQVQLISGGLDFRNTILRVAGVGQAKCDPVPWSLIVKTILCGPSNTGRQATHYWKREAAYYRSGLLDHLPGGLRAPRCYRIAEQADRVQLFLEDLQGLPSGSTWPVEAYRCAARTLGRFNGAYLAGASIPQADWIPRHWLRAYVEEAAPSLESFWHSTDQALVKLFFGVYTPEVIREVWGMRGELLGALDGLPQVFCHQDAFCRNLFGRLAGTGNDLAAVDWSYSGSAALGVELTPLVFASVGAGAVPLEQVEGLAGLAMEGYLAGLEDAGWRGDADLVRYAFAVTAAYRYPIGAVLGETFLPIIANPAIHPAIEEASGLPIEALAQASGALLSATYPYYQEAVRLKKKLGL